ncbi:MAG: hypothetical protein WC315_01925 [Candidatus Omnitrophota bacterium]|jgi:hypothetical protein
MAISGDPQTENQRKPVTFINSIFPLVIFIFGFFPVIAQADITKSSWQTNKSQHFIIYHQGVQPALVDDLISKAEFYYNSIVDDLGYRRFDFWSWENRAKIYLYRDAGEFQRETQNSSWAGAVVSVNSRVIKTYVGQSGFFDSILPHEMTHIIFREFIGKNIQLPLWIDEGVASSQEQSNLNLRLQKAKELIKQNKYVELNALSGVVKPDDNMEPGVFYSEAASVIVFLLREKGKEDFLRFSRMLRDGTDWKKALLKSFNFINFQDFEAEWKNFVLQQY